MRPSVPHAHTQVLAALPRNASSGALSGLLSYNGPIPAPTFDEFAAVHALLQARL